MKPVKEVLVKYSLKNKNRMTYRSWLTKYKGLDLDELTMEEHTKASREFNNWKVGNVEKVAGVWWNR